MATTPQPVRTALRILPVLSAALLIGTYVVLAQRQANSTPSTPAPATKHPPIVASSSKNLTQPIFMTRATPALEKVLRLESVQITFPDVPPVASPLVMPTSKSGPIDATIITGTLQLAPAAAEPSAPLTAERVLATSSKVGVFINAAKILGAGTDAKKAQEVEEPVKLLPTPAPTK